MSREQRIIVSIVIRVAAVVLIGCWLVLRLRRWDHFIGFTFAGWLRIPGVILMCAGGFVVLLCAASLATRGIFEQPEDRLAPASLATSGPFRYSRNPMSLAAVVLFAGLGLCSLSPAILLFAGLMFLLLHLLVIYVEEPKLRKHFGEAYLEYQRHTPRWLPSFRRGH